MSKKLENVIYKNLQETEEIVQDIVSQSAANAEEGLPKALFKEDKINNNEEVPNQIPKLESESTQYDTNIKIKDSSKGAKHSKSGHQFPFIPVIIAFVILILIGLLSTVFAFLNIGNNKIISGTYINDIDVSNLTYEQAKEIVSSDLSKKLNTTITLLYEDYEATLLPFQEIDATYDITKAVENAYKIGRSGNIFQNNFQIVLNFIQGKHIKANLQYNEEKLNYIVNNISLELPSIVQEPSYYIENNELIISKGKEGISLLQDETKNLIISSIENISASSTIDLPVKQSSPSNIDIEKIYSEVHTEPKNAYIIQEPFELNVGSSGTDFAMTIEEAKELLKENKETYAIPLKITPPEIGVEDLGDAIFVDTFSTFTSNYDVSNRNRSTNVELATSKINNVTLLPGEVFSYNKVVGKRTIANGFKEASIYTSSGVEYGLGGGICQVSSTLYNAVIEANLDIVERKNHRYYVHYVPLGRDATVSYGSIDFRFKNSRQYPIKIVASAKNGVVSISIKGIKEETEYDVTILAKKKSSTAFTIKYEDDSSLPVGTQKVKQGGYYGYKYETYRILSLNGKKVSETLLSTDTYVPLPKIIRVGTKAATVDTPTVQPPAQEPPAVAPSTSTTETPQENTQEQVQNP